MADANTEQHSTRSRLEILSEALASGTAGNVRRLVHNLHPAEIGDLLESLPQKPRVILWELVDPEDRGEVLLHVNDEVRSGLIREMEPGELVAMTEGLDTDDLADLLADLPGAVIHEVLRAMDLQNRERLEAVLSYPEDTAGRLMNPDVVTVRADVTVDVVLRYLRLRGELPEHTDHLYVVSKRHQYLGRIALQALLTHEANTPINALLDDEQPAIDVQASPPRRLRASSPTTTGSRRRWWTTTTSCSGASPSTTWWTSSASRPSTRRSAPPAWTRRRTCSARSAARSAAACCGWRSTWSPLFSRPAWSASSRRRWSRWWRWRC